MTIAESYRAYTNGKLNKAQFMERARKDANLRKFVTNVMTFDDTVRVLKNKGIISEYESWLAPDPPSEETFRDAVEEMLERMYHKELKNIDLSNHVEDLLSDGKYLKDLEFKARMSAYEGAKQVMKDAQKNQKEEGLSLEDAKKEAERISGEEGVVQHVNSIGNGQYKVSDWYDSDTTVASYENGMDLNEIGPGGEEMAGDPEKEAEYRAAAIKSKKKKADDDDDEFNALLKKYNDEEEGRHTKFTDISEMHWEPGSNEGDPYYGMVDVRNQDLEVEDFKLEDGSTVNFFVIYDYTLDDGRIVDVKIKGIESLGSQELSPEIIDKLSEPSNEKNLKNYLKNYVERSARESGLDETSAKPVKLTIKGKVVTNYKQNGDSSYSVEFADGTKEKVSVNQDGWDTLHDAGDKDKKRFNEAGINEAKQQYQIIPAEVRKGVNYELGLTYQKTPDWDQSFIDKATLDKTTRKVIRNLEKDSLYYTKLIGTGVKPKAEKVESEVKFKENAVKDTTNKTKADGYLKKEAKKDGKANVQTTLSKKERKKGKPEGVKQLKEGIVIKGSREKVKEAIKQYVQEVIMSKRTPTGEDTVNVPEKNKQAAAKLRARGYKEDPNYAGVTKL